MQIARTELPLNNRVNRKYQVHNDVSIDTSI